MEKLVLYFEHIQSWQRSLILAGGILFFWILIGAWLIHWLQHQVKWMWKFHLIHHSDTWVDTTTANRHHPGESLFRALFTLLAVLLTGAPVWLVFLYQSLSVVFAQFSHANISLPKWLDRALANYRIIAAAVAASFPYNGDRSFFPGHCPCWMAGE